MGCGGSKVDELPLVTLCRERKQYIKTAADHRYALSSAHLSYFLSLRDVGEALRRFVDEEIVFASSSSAPSSPVLTLPSDRGKKVKHNPTKPNNHNHKHNHDNNNANDKSTSSSGSISHIHSLDDDNDDGHGYRHGRAHRDVDNSHLHLSSDSDSDTNSEESGHIHIHDDDYGGGGGPRIRVAPTYYPTAQSGWNPYPMNPQPPPYRDTNWNSYPMDPQPPPYQPDYVLPYGFNPQPPAYQPDYGPPYGFNPQPPAYQPDWGDYGGNDNLYGYGATSNSRAYYMKKSAPVMRTVIHEHEQRMFQGDGGGQRMGMDPQYFNSSGYSGYPNEGGGFFGFPMGGTPQRDASARKQPSPAPAPPPPPAPQVSAWDFLNPFDAYDNGYPGYNTQSKYGYGSISSSSDSDEVRVREGIPDLEEETESEAFHKETNKKKKLNAKKYFGEGTSGAAPQRAVPQKVSEERDHSDSNEGNSERGMPAEISESPPKEAPWKDNEATWQNSEAQQPVNMNEGKSSPDNNVAKHMEEGYGRKKGVSFEIDEASMPDEESSKLSSLTTLSAHGTRDLQEVVNEIRDEFEIASGHGKEVAMMLEAGSLPYQSRFAVLKVVLSRILYLVAPSSSSTRSLMQSVRLRSREMKLARSYHLDPGTEANVKHLHLSSTLEKLYAWEKKLYREVKDEEKLRVIYEKLCKRLKVLDDRGAETSKIDATQASIRRLLTKLNVCIKAIDAISRRIQKLRDEELQPQVSELIHGLIRMWKSMLKCHQKQFQAILESKTRMLRANTGIGRDSSSRASLELENGLQTWCSHFSDWINAQKSYVKSLNGWLLRCLDYEPEDTADGIIPFSPGRIGAPPIFVICNDWHQGMNSISEEAVVNAMLTFASNLRQLWERQDEEQRQRLKAEYLKKDFDKRRKDLRTKRGKMRHDHDAMSDKTGASIVASDSGVSPLDDLKVDLDSLRHKMDEERARHKDAIKLVNDAASSSLQGGIIPIFKALESFTSGALKVHEQVRLQNAGRG